MGISNSQASQPILLCGISPFFLHRCCFFSHLIFGARFAIFGGVAHPLINRRRALKLLRELQFFHYHWHPLCHTFIPPPATLIQFFDDSLAHVFEELSLRDFRPHLANLLGWLCFLLHQQCENQWLKF